MDTSDPMRSSNVEYRRDRQHGGRDTVKTSAGREDENNQQNRAIRFRFDGYGNVYVAVYSVYAACSNS